MTLSQFDEAQIDPIEVGSMLFTRNVSGTRYDQVYSP